MQNKPNVKDAQINVKSYIKSKYEKLDTWLSGKNKPKQTQFKPNFNSYQTQSKPISTPIKPNPSGLRCLQRSCRTDQTQFPINPIGAVLPSEYYQKTCFFIKKYAFLHEKFTLYL